MNAPQSSGRHVYLERQSFFRRISDDWWDAVRPRTVLLICGVLLLQLGFILSYVGAFHAPKPHRIPIGVVAPSPVDSQTVAELNQIGGSPFRATTVASQSDAEQLIRADTLSAALILDAASTTDTLLVSSGGGVSVVTATTTIINELEQAQQRVAQVEDLVPLQPGDGRGLTGFYLVIGWIVGGYLVAAMLGVASGARPATPSRALFRLIALIPYSAASGLGGALIVDQGLGALTGHFLVLWGLGSLLVAAAGTVTLAFQSMFGVIGIGLTVLVFVVLGNASAGGAYQPALLPPFWRTISNALPNGAGTDTVRRIVYFGSQGITGHLILIGGYALGGLVLTLVGPLVRRTAAN